MCRSSILLILAFVGVFSHVVEVRSGNLYFGTKDDFSAQIMADLLPFPPAVQSITRKAKQGSKDRISMGTSHLGFIQASLFFDDSVNPNSNKSHPCSIEDMQLGRMAITSLGSDQTLSPVSVCQTDEGSAMLYPNGVLVLAFIKLGESIDSSLLKTFQPYNRLQEQIDFDFGEPLHLGYLKVTSGKFIVIISDSSIFSVSYTMTNFTFRVLLKNHNLVGVKKAQINKGYIFVLSNTGIHVFDVRDGEKAVICAQFKPTDLPATSDSTMLDFEATKSNVMTLDLISHPQQKNYTTYQSLFVAHRLDINQQEYLSSPDCLELLLVLTPSGVYFFHLTDFFFSRPPKYEPVLSRFYITLTGLHSIVRHNDCIYLLSKDKNLQGEWMSTIYEYFILDYSYLNWEYENSPPFELNRMWKSSYYFNKLSLDDDFIFGIMEDIVVGYQRGIGADLVDEVTTKSLRFADAKIDSIFSFRLPKESLMITLSKSRLVLYNMEGREPIINCRTKLDFTGQIHYQLNITTINCIEKIQSRRAWARDYSKKICRYLANFTYEIESLTRWERLTYRLEDPKYTSYVISGYCLGSLLIVLSIILCMMYRKAKQNLKKTEKSNLPQKPTEPQALVTINYPTHV